MLMTRSFARSKNSRGDADYDREQQRGTAGDVAVSLNVSKCPHLEEWYEINTKLALNIAKSPKGFLGVAARLGTVRVLKLRSLNLGDQGCDVLSQILCRNVIMITLDLSENGITDEGCCRVASALAVNCTLENIKLSSNSIKDFGCSVLADALSKNSTVRTVYIAQNGIGDVGCMKLANMLDTNTSVELLDLAENKVGIAGCQSLAASLEKNWTLDTLNLSRNQRIGDKGCIKIAEALRQRRNVQTDDIMFSVDVDDDVFRCRFLLKMRDCNISWIGLQQVLNTLESTHVQFDLTGNHFPCFAVVGEEELDFRIQCRPFFNNSSLLCDLGTDPESPATISRLVGTANANFKCKLIRINRSIEDLTVLGKGTNGTVFALSDKKALKKLHELSSEQASRVVHELELWSQMDHPNIVRFEGLLEPEEKKSGGVELSFVVERMQMTLRSFIVRDQRKQGKKNVIEMLSILMQIAQGLDYLHGKGILHGNLHSENVLINSGKSAKIGITDFSLAHHFQGQSKATSFRRNRSDRVCEAASSDVYDFGILMWEVLSRNISAEKTKFNRTSSEFGRFLRGMLKSSPGAILNCCQTFPDLWFSEVNDQFEVLAINDGLELIADCLDPDPRQRPSSKKAFLVLKQIQTSLATRPLKYKCILL
eukprot:TRINITY_DN7480_c0_g1_i1.p1 TRINITY_DN7480_c0_g1~~TRINITY_DN7480_c0_g1_i1.p1  ORF type:complete len:652 (-),score=147.43 TRINITY_DN7480_c0_g1_i1:1876-3831(-)